MKSYFFRLLQALEQKDLEEIQDIVKKYPQCVYEVDKSGNSPLAIAAIKNDLNTVKYLIEQGANPNQNNHLGDTAFLFAFELNHKNLCSYFLSLPNIEIDAQNVFGHSALFYACLHNDLWFAKTLLEKGADVNILTEENVSPLLVAASGANFDTCFDLIEQGADITIVDNRGESLATYAWRYNHSEMLDFIFPKLHLFSGEIVEVLSKVRLRKLFEGKEKTH